MKKPQTQFRMREGFTTLQSNKPTIEAKANYQYIWIGNNSSMDRRTFATLSGRKTLLKLAAAIRRCAGRK